MCCTRAHAFLMFVHDEIKEDIKEEEVKPKPKPKAKSKAKPKIKITKEPASVNEAPQAIQKTEEEPIIEEQP